MRHYMFIFVLAYFLITFILPTWRVKRQTGLNPFVVPNEDSVLGFIGRMFRSITFLTLVAVSVNTFLPEWNKYLLPFWYLERDSLYSLGWIILHLSLLLIMTAQFQMRQSWRIGIDEKNRTELVTTGLFRYFRNPVFLGMQLTMGGLFLVLPNVVTLLAHALTMVSLNIQVRMEEEFLKKTHGETYLEYCRRTPRWLF